MMAAGITFPLSFELLEATLSKIPSIPSLKKSLGIQLPTRPCEFVPLQSFSFGANCDLSLWKFPRQNIPQSLLSRKQSLLPTLMMSFSSWFEFRMLGLIVR
jgi:hypothetical protein